MKQPNEIPYSPGGAPLTSCDLDDNCTKLDCDAILAEYGDSLEMSDEGRDFLTHYCGLDYVDSLRDRHLADEWQPT